MRIGVCGGMGVVGSACVHGFRALGHTVYINDPKLEWSSLDDVMDTDIVFICVPTPSREDGACDTSIVKSTVVDLVKARYNGTVAIKSTCRPGFTSDLIRRVDYGKDRICFVPEFLRERCALADFQDNHDLLAVGTFSKCIYDTIVLAHGRYPKNTVMMTPTEAELLKYYSNCYNGLRVVFANEFAAICEHLGVSYEMVKNAFVLRGTLGDKYLDVNDNCRGFSGPCLPKDFRSMAHFCKEEGLNLKLFQNILEENSKFKATIPQGMRAE